jgi:ABC-type cobalamin/Fe3+-siderophores transport system ATPase subunit
MVLQLENWSVHRGNNVGVGPIDITFHDGEIITIMGPSGVGKTTLLMTILGYRDSGLKITGTRIQDSKRLSPVQVPNQALYIPQHLPFNPNWEVEAFLSRLPWGNPNVIDVLWPRRHKRVWKVNEVLKKLGLAHRARATVAELSGGEIQRAALAQMLLLSPRLLVGDEFVSALDPGMSVWILDQCRQEIRQSGGAAILALHSIHAALQISDRILLMWPTNLETSLWEIQPGSVAWHGDVLYTLLCLARWAKDISPDAAVRQLISYLHRWIHNENILQLFVEEFRETTQVRIDKKGDAIPFNETFLGLSSIDYSSNWTKMAPVHVSMHDQIWLGVALPRGVNQEPLIVLAGTGRPLSFQESTKLSDVNLEWNSLGSIESIRR